MKNKGFIKMYETILQNSNMDAKEKLLLCRYINLVEYNKKNPIQYSDRYIAELLGLRKNTFIRARIGLEELGYIEHKRTFNNGKNTASIIRLNEKKIADEFGVNILGNATDDTQNTEKKNNTKYPYHPYFIWSVHNLQPPMINNKQYTWKDFKIGENGQEYMNEKIRLITSGECFFFNFNKQSKEYKLEPIEELELWIN